MSDMPTEVINEISEANVVLSDQFAFPLLNYENWATGLNTLGGGLAAKAFNVSINVQNPSIYLQVTQLALAEQQRKWSLTIMSLEDNIRHLTTEIEELKDEIRQLCRTRTFVVPLTTLAPAPFQITQQIPVTIEGDGEEFTATFTEANISASGETEADAIANFKDSLLSCYQVLEERKADQLGALPTRQWIVLKSVVKRSE